MAYPRYHPDALLDVPMIWTVEDFRREFPGENEYVEFKQGVPEAKLREAFAAFSNSDGGVILIGVGPDGTVHGCALDGEGKARLHRLIGAIRNPGRYEIYDLIVNDRPVVVLSVARRREGFAQVPDGRVLVRRSAMNEALYGEDLVRFIMERALTRFEVTPTSLDIEDVDAAMLDRLSEAWGWSDRENVTARLVEQGLAARQGGSTVLTVAGALYLDPAPERHLGKTYIEIFRYRDAGDVYDKRTQIGGPLNQQVEQATAAILDELGSDVVVLGLHRHELPRIPTPVLREAIANAVAHRVYETARSAVRIEIRPDAVTVTSPGPLPEPVTVRNIRDQNAARNVAVIATLRRFRLAEDAGRGIDVMEDTMQANLLEPPRFGDDGRSVRVTLPLATTVTPQERAWMQEIEERGDIRPKDRILLVHAARGAPLTNSTVRDLLGVDSVDARGALQRLRDAGYLVQSGQRGGSYYTLARDLAPPAGLQLDDEALKALILGVAAYGPVSNEAVRERTGLDRARTLTLLNNMVAEGQLLRTGERRGTRYQLPDDERGD